MKGKILLAALTALLCLTLLCNFACAAQADVIDDLAQLFGSKTQQGEWVYLGGSPLGMTIDGEGVTVVGLNEFVDAKGGLCCPALLCGLQINDVIVELDGKKIFSSARLVERASASEGKPLSVVYLRQGRRCETQIVPQKDVAGKYRLGLWTRDSSGGIGTLTYVKRDLHFGSLGHPICDAQGNVVSCTGGGVFTCVIKGVEKGKKGAAGELKGTFSFDQKMGSLYANNKFGAFGTFDALPSFCDRLIQVADVSEVTPGRAQIYCTLADGMQSYEVEIVKASRQTTKADKGLVLHVTDRELLEKTGGIVQGMSGSPIVQNGKLVGAVTHVFVNDPTRGYGIYAKWMVEN